MSPLFNHLAILNKKSAKKKWNKEKEQKFKAKRRSQIGWEYLQLVVGTPDGGTRGCRVSDRSIYQWNMILQLCNQIIYTILSYFSMLLIPSLSTVVITITRLFSHLLLFLLSMSLSHVCLVIISRGNKHIYLKVILSFSLVFISKPFFKIYMAGWLSGQCCELAISVPGFDSSSSQQFFQHFN